MVPDIVLRNKYPITILILILLLAWSVQRNVQSADEIETLTKIHTTTVQELDTIKQTQVDRQKETVTVTTRPDGTIITKTEKVVDKTKVSQENADKSTTTSDTEQAVTEKNSLDRYSIGLYKSVTDGTYGASAGARIGNLPLFGEVLTTNNGRDWALGLEIHW